MTCHSIHPYFMHTHINKKIYAPIEISIHRCTLCLGAHSVKWVAFVWDILSKSCSCMLCIDKQEKYLVPNGRRVIIFIKISCSNHRPTNIVWIAGSNGQNHSHFDRGSAKMFCFSWHFWCIETCIHLPLWWQFQWPRLI